MRDADLYMPSYEKAKQRKRFLKSCSMINTYAFMIRRCYDPEAKGYKYYGGKGIKVQDSWLESFPAWYAYIKQLPDFKNDGTVTLDRIDNAKNYEEGNLRWATRKEQANNRTNNVRLALP